MATTKLFVKDGAIVGYDDRYFEKLSEDGKFYKGNGWTVKIKDGRKNRPGRIICHSERRYSDGPAVCHREFKLADGTVGLAGGNIHSRYAYFRTERFQNFLDKFGITAVNRSDPNIEFEVFVGYDTRNSIGSKVWTDGEVQWDDSEVHYYELPGALDDSFTCYEGYERCKISGATWAIVKTSGDWGNNHPYSVVLYTMARDVLSLEEALMSHPEIGPEAIHREKENRVWALSGTPIGSLADVESVLERACQISGIEKACNKEQVAKFMSDHEDGFTIQVYRGAASYNYGVMTIELAHDEQPRSETATLLIAKGEIE